MPDVAFVLHGHFYQPPRENPWTEVVPCEASAAPHHDWNGRITAECYRPNGWARILDEAGRIVAIVDNYEHLSFDVGPTLLPWLEQHAPETYERMLSANLRTGRAIAQGIDTRRAYRWRHPERPDLGVDLGLSGRPSRDCRDLGQAGGTRPVS